jgi:hydroxypyruvate reductase
LDTVKGGGLVVAAAPAQILGLILSDVVGDPLDVIASGPTLPNLQTSADALAVIEKYDLASQISTNILTTLETTTQLSNDSAAQPHNCLVGSNETAARAAITHAQQQGFTTELLTTTLQGEARDVGRELAGKIRKAATVGKMSRPFLMIAGGETTVTIRGDGAGGRNQEMALAAVRPLAGLEDVAFIALATDGGDGPTDAAGAVVTGETLGRAQALGMDPPEYLANNDSYTLFSKLGDCLMTGPTQTNVNDLIFLFAF